MDLTLPLDYTAIERILPHRYPFLLVDRIIELEPDKRIVGIKNVTLNERYLAHGDGEAPVLPPTILTEAVAQVGAIMILAKPENREKLIYFMGIERVRYRRPVHPGDVVVIEATVRRLRSRMGQLKGVARVNGRVVVEGTMTFALGPRNEGRHYLIADGFGTRPPRNEAKSTVADPNTPGLKAGPTELISLIRRPHDQQDPTNLRGAGHPDRDARIRTKVPPRIEDRRNQDDDADRALVDVSRVGHAFGIALLRTGTKERGARIRSGCEDVECQDALGERRVLVAEARASREQPLAAGVLHPETGGGDRELPRRRQARSMRDRKKRYAVEVDFAEAGIRVEEQVEKQVACLVCTQSERATGKKQPNGGGAMSI